ncbi:hypothetical protein Rhopal_004195-T1 [Rhodotorula paludigena]|uniref:Uncharacterized protein n=1 Tax=Rhodotorula paludigena TaxID=86838 RepID=A0AAV5GQ82_9BASI|nr:hypothetical protein Rhopal_004195-T1 [Rhodotorula paludigena]
MSGLDLKPLHGLYRTLDTVGGGDLPHPLVLVAQIHRKPASARTPSEPGPLEWIVALGSRKPETRPAHDGDAGPSKRRRRKAGQYEEEWWEARCCERDIEELLEIKECAIAPQAMISKIRERWLEGALAVDGYNEHESPRGGLELVITITPTLPLRLVLEPCDDPPLSLAPLLTIPAYLTASTDRAAALSAQADLAALRADNDKLSKQLETYRDERKRQRRVPGQLRQNSGGSNGGETRRGKLRPGDAGYAGSSRRIGRNLADDGFDEDPPSDD